MPIPTRMLLVDYALATPEINEGIAFPYIRAGCRVDYRPFYPNTVRDDFQTYRIIALLAGRTPAFPSGMMSEHEVWPAVEFVRNGGTLILGPNLEGGEGANERHLFNRILSGLDVPVRICNDQVADPVNRYAATLFDRPFYRPVPDHPAGRGGKDRLALERSTSLLTGEGVSVLLASFETAQPRGAMPVMALAAAGRGFVLVAGRYLLNAIGIPLRISGEPLAHPEWLADTGIFLQHLADYIVALTGDPGLWQASSPLPPDPVSPVAPPDFDLDRAPLLDRLPAGVHGHTYELPADADAQDPIDVYDRSLAGHYALLPDERRYGWIRSEGVRACWGTTVEWNDMNTAQENIGRIASALKGMDINVFWGIANCQAVGGPGYTEEERARVLQLWQWTAEALDGSPVKWYPTLDYRYFREEKTRCYGAQGQKLHAVSALDPGFWQDNWRNSMLAMAEFSLDHPCVAGLTMDVELYGHPPAYNYYMGYGFEDACYYAALDRWTGLLDAGLLEDARAVQLPDRFNFLRTRGLLEAYFTLLSDEVARLCAGIREDIWRVNPDLLFASYIFTTPCNWFDLGVYRGFSTPERPLILMTFNVRSGRMMEHLRRRGVYAYHTSVALLGMIRKEEYEAVFVNARRYGHGYWMNNVNALISGNPNSVESPARQGIPVEEAIRAIHAANQRMKKGGN
jgi:hypothetical protein